MKPASLETRKRARSSFSLSYSQCCETLLSPAEVVDATVAVAVDPRALDSREGMGFRVERCVRGSGAPDGAVVRCGEASAWDTPTEGGGKSAATVAAVTAVNPRGGEAVMGFVGAGWKEKIKISCEICLAGRCWMQTSH